MFVGSVTGKIRHISDVCSHLNVDASGQFISDGRNQRINVINAKHIPAEQPDPTYLTIFVSRQSELYLIVPLNGRSLLVDPECMAGRVRSNLHPVSGGNGFFPIQT